MGKSKKNKTPLSSTISKHTLYEASVQNVEVDYEFFQHVYKEHYKRAPRLLREDFCGTGILSCEWVSKNKENKAWAIDLDPLVLAFTKKHRVPKIGDSAKRIRWIKGDACMVRRPQAEIIAALNFSYSVFKQRTDLRDYFSAVYQSLKKEGLFIMDIWGGSGTMEQVKDKRTVPKSLDWNGKKIPKFTYTWEQAYFNHVNNNIICHINFKLNDGSKIKRAFTYDWRLWGTSELRDILTEVGFVDVGLHLEGWDEDISDSDGVFARRDEYLQMNSWVGYLVAAKS
jgi:SAM-dependent methyltransferase